MRESKRIKILILLVTIILIVLMFPKGESLESEVTVGSIWIEDDLIASNTFPVLKDPELYKRELQEAKKSVFPIFVKNESIPELMRDSLTKFTENFINLLNEDIFNESVNNYSKTNLSNSAYQTFLNLRRSNNTLSTHNRKNFNDIKNFAQELLNRIYRQGYIDQTYSDIQRDTIAVREGKYESVYDKTKYFDAASLSKFIDLYTRNNFSSNEELNNAVIELIGLFVKPDITYSEQLTEEAMINAENKISLNDGIVNENERIVAKHDRITHEIKKKIDSYRISKGEETGFWGKFAQNMGKFIHIIIIFTLFVIYIYLFRKRIYRDNKKILMIAIIILFVCSLTYLVEQISVNAPIELLVLVPVAAMLFTIIFDSRVGFYSTVIIALIIGGLRGNDYVFAVTNIIAGGLAAYTVRDIKNRTQIFRSFVFILIGYIASILAFGLERFASAEQMMVSGAFAASNALISPVLTYGMIIFFEKIFGITTDLTLLELTDFNTPVLKELARNAPGTFTHSMTIGSMVESAAETIGANSILARVGAYYHDIGKLNEPETFVENQLNNDNLHERITPDKSAKLIIDHVNRGIEIAKENNLPQEIIDFIPMHHGTMVVSYFYEKAKEQLGKDNVSIEDYKYPGPKPNSKETALVMLADACESTVRSMTNPEPQKVENVISNLFKQRIDDGQLDDSPVTMSNLRHIKDAFQKILIGQHHKRIRYPKQEQMENHSEHEDKDN
ncbi:MAG: HDIG domain-containing protein [Melioribacteraceae bacterium]|nr:HDIG domain-containing protein [Melioribacteraceae bacterium]MCF8353476.1 HDIG domain-containing protein [Melioribacteraceae bacterium]MCF8392605.1 HDIG domain-containing protein [Melioribacteraceae bacterium]MCF8418523.1 HDIG domain-containing protein [Melioribacteraceae bacterium]